MQEVTLKVMTRALSHEFFKGFFHDPQIFADMNRFAPYVYDEKKTDERFDRYMSEGMRWFAVMLDGKPIGEVILKNFDMDKRECEFGIHLQSDAVKEKGYGTAAERLMLDYAFSTLDMQAINASVILKNTRSQHVIEKVGFKYINQDEMFKYYRLDRAEWERIAK